MRHVFPPSHITMKYLPKLYDCPLLSTRCNISKNTNTQCPILSPINPYRRWKSNPFKIEEFWLLFPICLIVIFVNNDIFYKAKIEEFIFDWKNLLSSFWLVRHLSRQRRIGTPFVSSSVFFIPLEIYIAREVNKPILNNCWTENSKLNAPCLLQLTSLWNFTFQN